MTFTKFFSKIDQAIDLGDITQERIRVIAEGAWVEDDDYCLPIVNVELFWSFFSGLNVSVCKGAETYFTLNYREQDIYNASNNHFMTKKDKHTRKFAQEIANYIEFKTRDIYRELLKTSGGNIYARSANFPDVDCHPLTNVDDKFIGQTPLIPVVLENHVDILSIPIQKRVIICETLDTVEDTEHGTLFSQITKPTTKFCRDYEGINRLLMTNYVKIFEVLRNHMNIKQDMPNVWLVEDDGDTQIIIEFDPDLGFQFTITHKKHVVMSINRRRSFTSSTTMAGLEECIRSELEYHTGEYLSHAFETAVKDIMRAFKNTGDATNGDLGFVSWEVCQRDDDKSDSDDESDNDDYNDDDYNDNESGDESDNESGDESDNGSGDESDNESGDESDNESDDESESDNESETIYERVESSLLADYYDDTVLDVRFKLAGGSNYFWNLHSTDEYPFRTSSFGLLLCIAKELETRKSQEATALFILSKIERLQKKQRNRKCQTMTRDGHVTILYTALKCNAKTRAIIDIDGRIVVMFIDHAAKEVTYEGLLSDAILDRVLASWSPFGGECAVCTESGGFRSRCCNNMFHGDCAHRWYESCSKKKTPATCPMCRSERFV